VRHVKTRRFIEAFAALPPEIKAFELFCQDISHPSLSIERVDGYPGVWSGRVSQKYRWTFHFQEDAKTGERICVHRVIGAHDQVYRHP
jgi:hypothetical protein